MISNFLKFKTILNHCKMKYIKIIHPIYTFSNFFIITLNCNSKRILLELTTYNLDFLKVSLNLLMINS